MKELVEYLSGFVTENKRRKMEEVLSMRTRHLTLAVEDIYQPHNASAVIRTCDCFGVQELHIIENRNKYSINPDVTLGSSKWVDIIKHNSKETNNTVSCIEALKSRGYKVYATTPHKNDIPLEELPVDHRIALLFGNEKEGLSSEAIARADGYVRIPMTGFTESLNISVCAAVSVHYIMNRLWRSEISWKLTEEEVLELKLRWVKRVIRKGELLEKEFLSRSAAK